MSGELSLSGGFWSLGRDALKLGWGDLKAGLSVDYQLECLH